MSIQQGLLYRIATIRVILTNLAANANRILPDPANAQALLGVYADGFVKRALNAGAASNQYAWLVTGVNSDYDVRLTTLGGTPPAGPAIGSWHNLASNQIWTLSQPGGVAGSTSYSGTVEIRDTATLAVLASATFNWSATVTP